MISSLSPFPHLHSLLSPFNWICILPVPPKFSGSGHQVLHLGTSLSSTVNLSDTVHTVDHSFPATLSSPGWGYHMWSMLWRATQISRQGQETPSPSCQAGWYLTTQGSVHLWELLSEGQTALLLPGDSPYPRTGWCEGTKHPFGTTLKDWLSSRALSWTGQAKASAATASHSNFSLCPVPLTSFPSRCRSWDLPNLGLRICVQGTWSRTTKSPGFPLIPFSATRIYYKFIPDFFSASTISKYLFFSLPLTPSVLFSFLCLFVLPGCYALEN